MPCADIEPAALNHWTNGKAPNDDGLVVRTCSDDHCTRYACILLDVLMHTKAGLGKMLTLLCALWDDDDAAAAVLF